MEKRQKALVWWRNLPATTQHDYWLEYINNAFSPSVTPEELTGREIQNIWAVKTYKPKKTLKEKLSTWNWSGFFMLLLIVAIGLTSNKSINSFVNFILAFSCTIPLALLFAYFTREEK